MTWTTRARHRERSPLWNSTASCQHVDTGMPPRTQFSVITKIAYRGVLSGRSQEFALELDQLMAREYRRRTLNMKSSQKEHIFQSARNGGLGFMMLSYFIQKRKQTVVDRLDECLLPVQTAVWAMLHKAIISKNDTRNKQNVELWATSLLEYTQEGHHKLVLSTTFPVSLLENQVGDILPMLSTRDNKVMEEGGIATAAEPTTCDLQGHHWHPDASAGLN